MHIFHSVKCCLYIPTLHTRYNNTERVISDPAPYPSHAQSQDIPINDKNPTNVFVNIPKLCPQADRRNDTLWALARLRPTAKPARLATPNLNLCQHSVSHVRAAEMKLKQNNSVAVGQEFCFSFISVSFYMCDRLQSLGHRESTIDMG